MEIKTTEQVIQDALIEALEQPTKAFPINIKAWEGWFRFETQGDPKELEALVSIAAEFALRFKGNRPPGWITILGNSGNGKTHIAERLWEYLKNRVDWSRIEYSVGWIYWSAFVSELRAGIGFEKLREMQRWPALFLDDVGSERDNTGFASEQLNTLLGCRTGKWTILTSNMKMEQLAKIDPRIADRIIRKPNLFIEVKAKSYSLP